MLLTLTLEDDRQWSAKVISNHILECAEHEVAAAESNEFFFSMPSRGCSQCLHPHGGLITSCRTCNRRGNLSRVTGMFDPPITTERCRGQ